MNLTEIRKQYPQYDDLSDQELADGFHQKFYSDLPKSEFYKAISFDLPKVEPGRRGGNAQFPIQDNKVQWNDYGYGAREDGTPKGKGYFGILNRPDGASSSELSIGVEIDGKEVTIPTLVPTLSRAEIDHLLNGGEPTKDIVRKAADFARERMTAGKPVWATPGEEGKTQLPAAFTPATGAQSVRGIGGPMSTATHPIALPSGATGEWEQYRGASGEWTPPEEGWMQVGRKFVENIPAMFQHSAGGLVQAAGEGKLLPTTAPEGPIGTLAALLRARGPGAADREAAGRVMADYGKRIAGDAEQEMTANAPQVDPGSLKDYSYQIANTLVQMAPAIAVSVATRNPEAGLYQMGAQVFGDQYAQSRASGRSPDQAAGDASFYALAETIPEKMPLEALMKPGQKFLPKVLKTAGLEGVQEAFSEVLEAAYDKGIVGQDMTWGQAWQRVRDAGLIGVVVGGGISAGVHPFVHEGAMPAVQAPPGDREIPRAPVTPEDIASPIPTDLISEGKGIVAAATAQQGANDILAKYLPHKIGDRVTVDRGDGIAMSGKIADAFTTSNPDLGISADGLRVALDDGTNFDELFDTLAKSGGSIVSEGATPELSGKTGQLAQSSDLGLPTSAQPSGNSAQLPATEPAGSKQQETAISAPETVAQPAPTPPAPTGDGTPSSPIKVEHPDHIDVATQRVETAPTDGQKEAGNYAKAHIQVHGIDITLENPKGSTRSGVGEGGKQWSVEMPAHYGYVKRTTGADGDQFDVYVGDHPQSQKVWVVDQIDPKTGAFDEHKGILGTNTKLEALTLYDRGFSDGSGPRRRGAVTEMSIDQFRDYVQNSDTTKPLTYEQPAPAGMVRHGSEWVTPEDKAARIKAGRDTDFEALRKSEPNLTREQFDRRADGGMEMVKAFLGAETEDQAVEAAARVAAGAPVNKTPESSTDQGEPVKEPARIVNKQPNEDVFGTDRARFRKALNEVSRATVHGSTYGLLQRASDDRWYVSVQPEGDKRGRTLNAPRGSIGWSRAQAIQAAFEDAFPDVKDEAVPSRLDVRPGRKQIGVNPEGHPLFEDERGVRSYTRGGIRLTEPVSIIPGRGVGVDTPQSRTREEFMTAEEISSKARESAPPQTKEAAKEISPAKTAGYGSTNKLFTEDAAAKARALLRAKMGQINTGLDPEIVQAGITLAGYHIEAGARSFAAYAKAMIDDLGAGIKPYLRSWYEGVRYYPGFDATGMSSAEDIGAALAELDKGTTNETERDTISAQERNDGRTTGPLGDTGKEPLERVPADTIRGTQEGGNAGPGSQQSGGTDGIGNGRVAGPGGEPRRGVAGGSGTVSDATGGTGAGGQRGSADQPDLRRDAGSEQAGRGRLTPGQIAPAHPNYVITDSDRLGQGGQAAKFQDNLAAIRLLKKLEAENRRATPEEQAVLVRYVGWGGIKSAFPNRSAAGEVWNKGWETKGKELRDLLTDEEYSTAMRTVLDAHYTSEPVVRGIFDAVERFGFKGGHVLEPSMGTGNFFGMMPLDIRSRSELTGVELDHITGGIAKQLYPGFNVLAPMGFQDAPLADNHFDIAIGNPPFGITAVPGAKEKDIKSFSIHNYFFARTINKLRPGGIMSMVVTHRFLDKVDGAQRDYIAHRAKFLGAIRLPNTAFQQNALTEVTTDIVFLQKLPESQWGKADKTWTKVGEAPDPLGGEPMPLNQYFIDHPEMLLGRMERSGTMRQANEPTLAPDDRDLAAALKEAIGRLPANVYEHGTTARATPEMVKAAAEAAPLAGDYDVGAYFMDGDRLMRREETPDGSLAAVPLTPETQWTEKQKLGEGRFARIVSMVKLRNAVRTLLGLESGDNVKATEINLARKQLNNLYDAFVAEHGYLNDRANESLFKDDPDAPLLLALEKNYDGGISPTRAKTLGVPPRKSTANKMAIFTQRVISPYIPVKKADNPRDALAVSLAERGVVDVDHMAELTGQTPEQITAALHDDLDEPLIYRNPETESWETASQYLAGNVKAKEKAALRAGLSKNAEQLRRVFPADLKSGDINIRLGASWVDPKYYFDFARNLFGAETEGYVAYIAATGGFAVNIKSDNMVKLSNQWGTDRLSGVNLLDRILNSKEIVVRDKQSDGSSVVNKEDTEAALQKAQEIRDEFADWIMKDADRREALTAYYNENFNNNVEPKFDGSHLTLPGKVPDEIIKMRRHQRNAIWRGIQQRTALLDHVVGAGKTFTMVAQAMELRRMGLARKPLLAVPNHLVQQWASDFYRLYPGAKILTMRKKDFEAKNRKRMLAKIATGDWDAVIIAHSSFGFIPVSKENAIDFMEKQIDDIQEAIDVVREQEGKKSRRVSDFVRKQEVLKAKIQDLLDKPKDDLLTFEELGVDQLFIDEAHEFKNLFFTTSRRGMLGLGNPNGSKKAMDLFMKTQLLLQKQGGKGVIFATGTPISNSLSEMYTVQRYLGLPELENRQIKSFDAWLNNFGNDYSDYELDGTGVKYKQVNRLRALTNVPEVMAMYRQYADSVTLDQIKQAYREENPGKEFPIPPVKGGKRENVVVPRSDEQAAFFADIIKRAENIKAGSKDNMLAITTDARKAALDMRLIAPEYGDQPGGKTDIAADNIAKIWRQWERDRGTQLVFLDLSIPLSAAKKEGKGLQDRLDVIDKAKHEVEKLRWRRASDKEIAAAEEHVDELETALSKDYSEDEITAIRSMKAGFSVYDDLKAKLLERGIPANEIAFIHDFGTDDKKADLFEQVNAGRIRVLLGSTAKMGAGTNVQQRVVALHHIDCPWRPSDIEQREGRVIRQGNLLLDKYPDFAVQINAYATEQTYDARMWQVQEQKLLGIEGLRNFQGEREMEEVSAAAASAAEMKAAATGNPLILEDVQLSEAIRKLESAQRAHRRNQYDLEERQRRNERTLADVPQTLPALRADAEVAKAYMDDPFEGSPPRGTVEGSEVTSAREAYEIAAASVDRQKEGVEEGKRAAYSVEINGKPYTSQEAIGDAITAHWGDARPIKITIGKQDFVSRPAAIKAIEAKLPFGAVTGKIGGFDFTASSHMEHFLGEDRANVEVTVSGETSMNDAAWGPPRATPIEQARLALKLVVDQIKRFESALAHAEYRIERARAEGPDIEANLGKPWPKESELAEKKARHAEVRKLLTAKDQPTDQPKFSLTEEPVARLTGDELGVEHTGPETMPGLRAAARDWYNANLRGTTAKMADGREVTFSRGGMGKSTSGPQGDVLLRAVPAIRAIIEKGEIVDSRPGDRRGVLTNHVVMARVELAGRTYRMGVTVRETTAGTFQYDFFNRDGAGGQHEAEGAGEKFSRGTPAMEGSPGGLNLFLEDDSGNNIATPNGWGGVEGGTVSDRFAGDINALKTDLEKRLTTLGLNPAYGLRLMDNLKSYGGNPRGLHSASARVIGVSLEYPGGHDFVLNHEAIHALRDLGLFRPAEWTTLEKAAQADAERMAEIRSRYAGRGLDEAGLTEEAIADMFADWAAGRSQVRGFIQTAFERIKAFFLALRDTLFQNGYRAADDIFRAVDRGEVGRRQGVDSVSSGESTEKFSSDGDQTETPAFKRWFGDSKVVDESGKPLVVYHGTAANFDVFDKNQSQRPDLGYYFSSDPSVSEEYGNQLMPIYLSIKNPLVIDAQGRSWSNVNGGHTGGVLINPKFEGDEWTGKPGPNGEPAYLRAPEGHPRAKNMHAVVRDAIALGHDGLIVKNVEDTPASKPKGWEKISNVYVAFDPKQIKSAIGNNGNFDPTNPDIRYSLPARPAGAADAVTFDNEETEARWKDARRGAGVNPDGWLKSMSDWFAHLAHGFTAHYIHLPTTAEYADVGEQLRKLEAAPQASKEQVIRIMRDLTKGFTPDDLDLFTRKVVLDDLSWEADQEHALPFGMTPDDVTRERAKVDSVINRRPDLAAAVRQRKLITNKVADDLVAAGVLHASQIKNPAYYRHQVLDYARATNEFLKAQKGLTGAAKRLRSPHWARRMGSQLDINANLLEAEFDWLHKAFTDIRTAKTIDWIKKSKHNIRSDLVRQAREANKTRLQAALDRDLDLNGYADNKGRHTSPLNEALKGFNQKIAIGLGKVKGAIEAGHTHIPPEFERAADNLTGDSVNEANIFPLLSWIMDNDEPGADGAGMAFKAISQRKQWMKAVLGDRYVDPMNIDDLVSKFAPEGYVAWQPDEGRLLYTAKTLPEKVIDHLLDKIAADSAGPISANEMRAAMESVKSLLAVGGDKYQMVIPQELAATLNSLRDPFTHELFDFMVGRTLSEWKRWTLINPLRVLKYNLNNLSGDLDAVIAGNPRALKKMGQAISELYAVMLKGDMPSQSYRDAVEHGVFDSGLSVQEIPEINDLDEFKHLLPKPETLLGQTQRFTLSPIYRVWKAMQKFTTFRENWLRYAAYLDYAERVAAGETMESIGYGASNRELIDAITDPKDKAARLARDLVGDYGNISHYGRQLRRYMIPFYSFMEINARRYWRLGANAYGQGIGKGLATSGAIGVALGVRTTAYLTLRIAAMYMLMTLWNRLLFGDDEDDLPPEVQNQMHLNLGRGTDGRIITLRMQGALSDALSWFGFADAMSAVSEVNKGRASLGDVLEAMAKAPVNKIASGLTPVLTLPLESAAGVSIWPDVFDMRPIRDGWRNFFQTFSLDPAYDWVMGKPSRGAGDVVAGMLVSRRDPGEAAYNRIKGLAADFMERKTGQEGSSTLTTPRANALYEWKQAKRYGDKEAEQRAYERMKELHVTVDDRRQSLKRAHPMGGVPMKYRAEFKASLDAKELQQLEQANEWYRETFQN